MRIIIEKNYEEMSKKAANLVAAQIYLNPKSVLGLATGSTPLRMYCELVRMNKENGLDFGEITTFNLDEYVDLDQNNENSYNYYMNENFFRHVNIKKENIYIPRGKVSNLEEECKKYEEKISSSGGIDLQVLGIGNNGHIGFNEPNLKFEATTHVVKLDDDTINANSRFFNSIDEVPKFAISMGIKTIMHARKILLLASGVSKARILREALYGEITPEVPASILQLHPDVAVVVDEDAARYL